MEPITIVTTALTLATPYLIKTGEKIAESIGEDIWKLIKSPFSKDITEKIENAATKDDIEKLKPLLLEKLTQDKSFADILTSAIEKAQNTLTQNQQNITNNSTIEKQINIQNNHGNISM